MNYYKMLSALRNANDNTNDNDLIYFKQRIKSRKYDIEPPRDFHNKYEQFYDYRRFSLHDDLVNSADLDNDNSNPWKKPSSELVMGIYASGRNYEQPIFNNDLLNEMKANGRKVVYSRRK